MVALAVTRGLGKSHVSVLSEQVLKPLLGMVLVAGLVLLHYTPVQLVHLVLVLCVASAVACAYSVWTQHRNVASVSGVELQVHARGERGGAIFH
ncbi:MAG: hypothetical protein HC848_09580 [Limnobacter sp.]|nr:hypothetical protein [Limnobacter sp.]